jgi:hypothetical protein
VTIEYYEYKKNPEQISSGSFSYLLNLGRVTSEGSRNNVSINRNWLLPEVSPLLPVSSLKVVGALNNYSLVFLIFIIFFGQVLFLVSCPKGQVEKYVNVEAWLYKCLLDFILISSFLINDHFQFNYEFKFY